MKETYTLEDVAAMSRLSTRTIRNYMSMGLLEGEKTDGVWQFTAEQFSAFLRQDMVRQSVRAKANGMVYDFLLQERRREKDACAVLDLPAATEAEEQLLREELMACVNALGVACSYRYDPYFSTARLILQGPPRSLAQVLQKFA